MLDMNFAPGEDSGDEGLARLGEVMTLDPEAVVVMVTAHGDVDQAVKAMKKGAADFVTKPWVNERLVATLMAALNLRRWRTGMRGFPSLDAYRTYLVNHEVGHGLDRQHVRCARRGALAHVMVPQSRSLYGCRANGWPYP